MATILQGKCRAYGTVSGNSPRLLYFHERQGETFKKGCLLYLNASNYLRYAPMSNGCGTAFDTIRKRIIGIAAKDAKNLTTTAIFLSNCFSETSAAASSLAYADEGKALTASVNSSLVYVELAASAASTILKVVQFIDNKGDRYGRVLWQLLPGARALGL
jgi:hypothetical protein